MASITEVPTRDGRKKWIVNWDEPSLDGKRKQRRKTFYSKREADAFKREKETEIAENRYVSPSKITLDEHVQTWLSAVNLKPNSIFKYRQTYRLYVKDQLGCLRLQAISPMHIQKLILELCNRGYAYNTVDQVRITLSSAFRYAVEWNLIHTNPVRGVKIPIPRYSTKDMVKKKVWTPEQAEAFFEATKDSPFFLAWHLQFTYGMRPGEVVALTWDQVDLEKKLIRISRTQTLDRDGKRTYGTPKSRSSNRELPLIDETVDLLRAHRAKLAEMYLRLGRPDGLKYLFPAKRNPFVPADAHRLGDAFRKYCYQLGIPQISPHGLRHTAATRMIRRGVNPRVVQEILGHSTVSTTLDIYVHVDPDDDMREALERARL